MNWEPPKSYLVLLQKALTAGYQPNEIQKEWLAKAQQLGENKDELPKQTKFNSSINAQ